MSFDKIVIERSSPDRWAGNPPRRRPRLGEMPSRNREGSRGRLQGSQRPPRVPRGHTLEAKHGHSRSIMYQEIHQRAERLGHCHRSPTHCSSCCARSCLPLRYKTLLSTNCYETPKYNYSIITIKADNRKRTLRSIWTPSIKCHSIDRGLSHSAMAVPCNSLWSRLGLEKPRTSALLKPSSSNVLM